MKPHCCARPSGFSGSEQDFCDVLGIVPQSWKLRAAGRNSLDLDSHAEAQYVNRMIKDFRACEFSFLMRCYWRRRFPFLDTALHYKA